MASKKSDPQIQLPAKMDNVDNWIIFGLDPSLSRTGFAMMQVSGSDPDSMLRTTTATWLSAGSVKPENSKDPIWIRGKAMALWLRQKLRSITDFEDGGRLHRTGLIVSMEYPTPMDDFLVALNRVIHQVLLTNDLPNHFEEVRVLTTNASTLRSLMGLYKKGNNKNENIARAYDFINKEEFPQLDSDACDAVLLAMMGRYTASILLDQPIEVPERFLATLCSAKPEIRGKGKNQRVTTKGLLHTTGQRPEYWYAYEPKRYTLCVKDAASPKKTLAREQYSI